MGDVGGGASVKAIDQSDAINYFKFKSTLFCGVVLMQQNTNLSALILLQCLAGKCKCIDI